MGSRAVWTGGGDAEDIRSGNCRAALLPQAYLRHFGRLIGKFTEDHKKNDSLFDAQARNVSLHLAPTATSSQELKHSSG